MNNIYMRKDFTVDLSVTLRDMAEVYKQFSSKQKELFERMINEPTKTKRDNPSRG